MTDNQARRDLITAIILRYNGTRLSESYAASILTDPGLQAAFNVLCSPANVDGTDWFKGEVDCDGNELVTIRADELQQLRDEREKFMWQVRDTCARAEKAERRRRASAALAATETSG